MIRRSRVSKTNETKVTFALPQDQPAGPVSVTVPAGTSLRFRYLGDNGHWFDDPDADRREHDACVLDV